MSIPRPTERPSFGQRDAYRDVLSEGYAQGRLHDDEFRRRVDEAAAASSLGRLEELIADLPRGDLPVPAAQIRAAARREANTARQTSSARRGLAVTAAVLVGALGGFLAGSAVLHARAPDTVAADTTATDSDAEDTDTDTDATDAGGSDGGGSDGEGAWGDVSYGDVIRAAELAADQDELSRLTVSDTTASVHVPTEAGTTYDVVSAHENGRITTRPGGTYGDDEADARIDDSVIDGDTLAAMILAAPDVYATTTGNTAHAAATLDVHVPTRSLEYAGVEPGTPVVQVRLGMDEYGSGGGTVVWTVDGTRVLQVIE